MVFDPNIQSNLQDYDDLNDCESLQIVFLFKDARIK